MPLHSSLRLIVLFSFVTFFSCSNDPSSKENTPQIDSSTIQKEVPKVVSIDKSQMVISDIPFPFEILDNLHNSHIPFDQKAMNVSSNIAKYNQYNSKALNLGVYGADLAYSVTYEQFQQIGNYVKSAKKLADDLNIPFAFNEEMMDKYNLYKENKDSLTQAVFDSYTQVDKSLRNDERVGIASLVVAGSWLEGLYLSTHTFVNADENEDNKVLYKTILGQKKSLVIVVKLLSEHKDQPYFASLINDLNEITSAYSKITTNSTMNEHQLIELNKKVESLRNKITEGL